MFGIEAVLAIALISVIVGAIGTRFLWRLPEVTNIGVDEADPITDGDRLIRMLDLLPDPLVILDEQGSLFHANVDAQYQYGESVHALVRHPSVHIALNNLPEGEAAEVVFSLDVPIRRVIRASLRRLPVIPYGHGMVLAVLADRTEQDAIERMRADFVAYASHELRTPLAALKGFIETLQGPAASDPQSQQQFLGIMAAQAQRMQRLIDRLLYLSRVQMLEHQQPRQIVDVATLLDRVSAEAGILAQQSNVELIFHREESGTTNQFRGDIDQTVQVLMNLIENAIKYAGGLKTRTCRVDVSIQRVAPGGTWPMQPGLVISVTDNGIGIDARHIPRLTERFYRVEGSAAGKQGTGLGLSIVKHIVDRHGGKLVFESEIGKGTTCLVWIPRLVAQRLSSENL